LEGNSREFTSILLIPNKFTFFTLNPKLDLGTTIVTSAISDIALERSWQATPNPPFIIGGNSHPNIKTFGRFFFISSEKTFPIAIGMFFRFL
jgi:hypothetical protein